MQDEDEGDAWGYANDEWEDEDDWEEDEDPDVFYGNETQDF
jgi:hypothetical protein